MGFGICQTDLLAHLCPWTGEECSLCFSFLIYTRWMSTQRKKSCCKDYVRHSRQHSKQNTRHKGCSARVLLHYTFSVITWSLFLMTPLQSHGLSWFFHSVKGQPSTLRKGQSFDTFVIARERLVYFILSERWVKYTIPFSINVVFWQIIFRSKIIGKIQGKSFSLKVGVGTIRYNAYTFIMLQLDCCKYKCYPPDY